MPDLNWYKREVSEEMDKSMIFWLDEGVDGFRIDSVPHMFEIPIDKMVDADDVLRNPWEKDSTLTEVCRNSLLCSREAITVMMNKPYC